MTTLHLNTATLTITHRGRILLLKERDGKWGTPGGKIDETDESPLDASEREFKEETGCDYSVGRLLNRKAPLVLNRYTFGYVLYVQDFMEVVLSAEHSEFHWAKLEEVYDGSFERKYGPLKCYAYDGLVHCNDQISKLLDRIPKH